MANSPAIHALLAVLLLATAGTARKKEPATPVYVPPKYRLRRIQLAAGPGGPQAGVSRCYGIVNFGSRDGVRRGSVFNVTHKRLIMGRVRVDRVWRDSARVSVIALARKADPGSPYPLEPGYYLTPHYVLLETIQFHQGKPNIEPAMHERLHYASRFIRAYPSFPLILEGHTDNTGEAARNQKLSVERAQEIKLFLHEVMRLPDAQMHVKGYGETDPIASNASAAGRASNRRVDIILADAIPE